MILKFAYFKLDSVITLYANSWFIHADCDEWSVIEISPVEDKHMRVRALRLRPRGRSSRRTAWGPVALFFYAAQIGAWRVLILWEVRSFPSE